MKGPGILFVASLAAALVAVMESRSAAQKLPSPEPPPGETPSPQDVDAEDGDPPGEPVEAAASVVEVDRAMEDVERELKQSLPEEFTIEFGNSHDWMRLTSGEWLKGRVKRMRDKEIEFDSDKLDVVTFDWEKVDRLHCPEINTYVFENKVDVTGRAVVTKDTILIETADGMVSYPRGLLLSIVDGRPRERNWWSSRLGVGFSANAGNTNQGSLNAYFQLTRADYRTRSQLRYDGTVGYADRAQNVNRHIGNAEVRLFISRRWYFWPGAAQFLNDRFQNIKLRATPGAGAGVHIFDTKRWKWDADAGLGYQYIEFLSTAVGVKNPQSDGFVSMGTWAELEFYKDIKLELRWRTNLMYTTIGNTNHTGEARFTIEVADVFDFEISYLFLRTEDPPPRVDGTTPARNDHQLIIGVALEID